MGARPASRPATSPPGRVLGPLPITRRARPRADRAEPRALPLARSPARGTRCSSAPRAAACSAHARPDAEHAPLSRRAGARARPRRRSRGSRGRRSGGSCRRCGSRRRGGTHVPRREHALHELSAATSGSPTPSCCVPPGSRSSLARAGGRRRARRRLQRPAARSRTLRDLTGAGVGVLAARARASTTCSSAARTCARAAALARRRSARTTTGLLSDHAPVEVDDRDELGSEARARFPVLERFAYLNAGTFGPLSRATLDAMAELRSWEGEPRARRQGVLRRDARAPRARACADRGSRSACRPRTSR